MDVRAYWLWLVLVFGPADSRIWQLSKDCATARDFVGLLLEDRIQNVPPGIRERVKKYSIESALDIIKQCESSGISVYCYESEGYPERLKEITNPPAVIFVKGSLDFLENSFLINVAGARSPSEYSKRITGELCRGLCSNGCVIVSGMTEGIDTLANRTALDCECSTLGVCGLAIDVYDENSDEFIKAVTTHGALISETCSAMECQRPKFSQRNRLLTALCDAVVFVEGSLNSRGLDICEHAIMQGKFLFIVPPHDITDRRYQGQSWLIRRGCRPLFSVQDVLYYIAHLSVELLDYASVGEEYSDIGDYSFFVDESPENENKSKRSRGKRSFKNEDIIGEDNNKQAARPDLSELDETGRMICELIADKPLLADAIAAKLGMNISEVLSKLTMLELDGFVRSLPGKQFGMNI